jgi:hypothetical protein
MPVVGRLRDVVDALDPPDDWAAYLNLDTGEVITVSGEERRMVERNVPEDDLPDWQREALPRVREALDSDRFVPLPDRFKVHEWGIMERFSVERTDPQRNQLLDAIHGPGAFRRFKQAIRRLGIEEEWHRYRDSALEEIAKEWLEAHGLAYE